METEVWHVEKMKELANIATALQNRHLAAKKILAATSSKIQLLTFFLFSFKTYSIVNHSGANKSTRLQTLEQRITYLTGVLLGMSLMNVSVMI